MKKTILISISALTILILIFWNDIRGYTTLEKAIKSQWKTPVEIVNYDKTNKLVIYRNQTQYVFGVYRYKFGRYYYNNDIQSSGWTASSESGPAFLVRAESKRDKGNFIWGALYAETPIEKFLVEYKNMELQEAKSINNTFILKMPNTYENVEGINLMTTFKNVKAYDKDNILIRTWSD
ncbi:MAG: hypothetical protein K6T94_17090 [Paenibacillus sp.]|nr:hypothetical protein [Paenibacillus sp.]